MTRTLTAAPWVARNINPNLDNAATWKTKPPLVDAGAGVVARLELTGFTEDQVRAHARAIAAVPELIAAALDLVDGLDREEIPLRAAAIAKDIDRLRDALAAAGVRNNGH